MNRQLFHVLPTLTLPHSSVKHQDGTHVTSQTIPGFPFMHWPSGWPCEPVNLYFLDIAHQHTGDSLKTYAAQLTHLVRYCGQQNVTIEDLTDLHLKSLSAELQEEKSIRRPLERARNDNTVREILSRIIAFLQWYQQTLMLPSKTPLIGEAKKSPQITIKKVATQKSWSGSSDVGFYYVHSAMPSSESREPKRPIALSVIEDIKRCVLEQSVLEEQSKAFTRHRKVNRALLAHQLEYMKSRRLFMIWMMMHTGLRPSELVEMSVRAHQEVLSTKVLELPTKKKRKLVAPIRRFPVKLDAAAAVYRYLNSRATYIGALREAGMEPTPSDAFFLSIAGVPVKKTSLEKDFERLAASAGYRDVQACLSMFRHRFITYEVTAHLKEFITGSRKSRQMMTDVDYESILKRVSAKTGHGSVQSLWHYIDLAWEELGVWGSTDAALERLRAAEKLFDELLELQFELKSVAQRKSTKSLAQRHDRFVERLGEILATAKAGLDVQVLHGKQV